MTPISKAEAATKGFKRYFTGEPCLRGHIAERLVSTSQCLECQRERMKARYDGDPEAGRAKSRRWHEANRDKSVAAIRVRYAENAEARREYARQRYAADIDGGRARGRARYAANPTASKSSEKRRRAAKKRAVPVWFGELDDLVWREASALIELRRSATGVEWHVDHMVPLKAKIVSGLHTWNNCQVIPAKLNMFKKNKLIFVLPCDWLEAMV